MNDGEEKNFYREIVADKKPYFMRYIYPALMKQYNTYIKNTNRNALREFQMSVDEMRAMPYESLTEKQKDFLRYYDYRMPVGVGECIMNKICYKIEKIFDGYLSKHNSTVKFDYSIMKGSAEYTSKQFYAIKKIYEDYNKRLQSYMIFSNYERTDEYETLAELASMNEVFCKNCAEICPNKAMLSNIILDICYTRSATKRFAWNMCGDDIIHNLLEKNDYTITFPTLDTEGDVEFGGKRYSIKRKKIEVAE